MMVIRYTSRFFFFFFNDPATTEIYTLPLHDALPISRELLQRPADLDGDHAFAVRGRAADRSEEHTSELQSRSDLVCRLLLEKKNKSTRNTICSTVSHATAPLSSLTRAHRVCACLKPR